MFTQRIVGDSGIKVLEDNRGFEPVVDTTMSYNSFITNYDVDRLMEAVLTVLLKARNEQMSLCYMSEDSYSADRIGDLKGIAAVEEYMSGYDVEDKYIVIENITNQETFDGFQSPEGYRSLDDIVLWMDDNGISAKAYTSKEEKKTFILIRDINPYIFHILTFLSSRLAPWVFDDKPLSPEERDLFMSLYNDDVPEFTRKINVLANDLFNFRELSIRNALDGYGPKYAKNMGNDIRRDIERLYDEIRTLTAKINDNNRQILQKSIILQGLDGVINEQMDNLLSFVLAAKNIEVVATDGPYITFQMTSELVNYDIDDAEAVIHNNDAYMYNMNSRWTLEQEKALLKAIFIDQIFTVKMIAVFKVNFISGEIQAVRGFFTPQEYEDYMKNQHIFRHSCLGGNEEQIRQFLSNRDYVGALSACIAATGNININEPVSNDAFFAELFTTRRPVLRYQGDDITVDMAIEIIEQEATHEEA